MACRKSPHAPRHTVVYNSTHFTSHGLWVVGCGLWVVGGHGVWGLWGVGVVGCGSRGVGGGGLRVCGGFRDIPVKL